MESNKSSKLSEKASLSVQCEPLSDMLADPGWPDLLVAYTATSLQHFDTPAPDFKVYQDLVGAGVFFVCTARAGGALVGFATLMVHRSFHHTRPVGKVESIFVYPEHRKGGTAARLLAGIDAVAAALNCQGVGLAVPAGNPMGRAMRGLGYTHTHEMLFKPCKS